MKIKDQHINQLISKYISKEINKEEFHVLEEWLNENEAHKTIFIERLKFHKINLQTTFLKSQNPLDAWERIISKLENPIQNQSKSQSKIRQLVPKSILKYAVAAILLISIGYYYNYTSLPQPTNTITDSITLELGNGTIRYINEDGSTEIKDLNGQVIGSQKQNELIYKGTTEEKLVYNTLTIPYGKRFKLQLSDGTIVHLNAGTTLKYPTHFIKGKNREVFLTGEAFFKVAKDAKHPFIVNAQNLDIKVLGTAFNVSAYTEDTNTDVVLVEGAVEMFDELESLNNKKRLQPGDKGIFNRKNSNIETKQVNTGIYTSWVQGELFFRQMPFENIAKKLERHFNVTIIIENKALNQEIFNASFKNEPIENILNYFNKSFDIKYKKENTTFYIN